MTKTGILPSGSRWFRAACLAAVALFAAAYGNSLRNEFHFDDLHVIAHNLFVRDLANAPRFFTDARTFSSLPQNAVYRPLVSLSVALDYRLAGGLDPLPYHVTQLTLFAAVGVLLLLLYQATFATAADPSDARWAALLSATLFCVHTANTQTGNYISARSELLASLGILGAFLAYIAAPSWRRYHLYLLPVIAGALGKNLAVMFAPLLLAYKIFIEAQLPADALFTRASWPRTRAAIASCIPAFLLCGALFVFIERMSPPGQTYGGGGRAAYLATQAWVWVRYASLYFVPMGLSADTDLRPFAHPDARSLAGALLLVATLAVAWRASRSSRSRPVTFGILWFWIALVPTSSIFPLAELTNDHRVFLPYIGLNLAVVWAAWTWAGRAIRRAAEPRRAGAVLASAAAGLLVVHSVATFERNRVWRDEESLWQDVAEKSPRNGRGLMNYGISQMQKGRLTEARDLFVRAQEFSPAYPYLEVNLGIVSDALGDQEAAAAHFARAIALDPDQPVVHRHYGYWLLKHGRGPEAREQLERLVALSAGDGEARDRLMQLYAAIGATQELLALARESARLDGTDPMARAFASGAVPLAPQTDDSNGWYLLGWSLTRAERHLDAALAYRQAVARDARNADAWNNLGWTLGKLGFHALAVTPLERAVALRPDFELARNNLAWVRGAAPRGGT